MTVFGKERLRNVLNTSRRRVNKNSLTWWYALKTSWRYLYKTSWRRFEDVLKMSWRRFEDVLKTSSKRLEDVWPRRIYCSWPRSLEDVLKTSFEDKDERRFRDVFKTSSWRLHQDEFLLDSCWNVIILKAHSRIVYVADLLCCFTSSFSLSMSLF